MKNERLAHSEKFSFLVVKKGEIEIIEDSQRSADLSMNWDRLIRPILHRKKHRIIDVCSIKGKILL